MAPHAHMLLFLGAGGDQATRWLQTDIARFFEELICELPAALERVLGNQVHDVKPRWAKGTAHRVARLLSDHIDELERKDALLGDRSEEHTSELQSLMRISYAVFCLKKNIILTPNHSTTMSRSNQSLTGMPYTLQAIVQIQSQPIHT